MHLPSPAIPPAPPSFPTRRSSDLGDLKVTQPQAVRLHRRHGRGHCRRHPLERHVEIIFFSTPTPAASARDRKSTRPELQSRGQLVCRLLLEKKKTDAFTITCNAPS